MKKYLLTGTCFNWASALAAGAAALTVGASAAAQTGETDRIVVTGTRIQSPNLESPNPITSISSEGLAYTGKTSIQELVLEVGALVGSEGDSEVSSGEGQLVLRNLGANRTLVLVDGQRFVGGFEGSTAVDTNVIPLSLVERVDVLTGGASAIYGADAVTGVVNFILKDDFEGIALDAQYGNAQRGDFRDQQYSVTAGHNFADGRGNITLNYTYGERPLVLATARDASSVDVHEQINNIGDLEFNGVVPQFILAPGTQEAFFTDGGARIDPFGQFSSGFNGDGSPFENGTPVGSFAGTGQIGGDGIPNWLLFAQGARPSNERHIASLRARFDVSDAFRPFIDFHYSQIDNRSVDQHSLTVGSQAARDNAFLAPEVLDAANAAGWLGPIFFNRWDLDSGVIDTQIEKETLRFVVGAKGDLTDFLSYDLSVNYGKVNRDITVANNRMFDRYIAAIDSVVDPVSGEIVCRSNLDPSAFNTTPGDFLATSFDASLGAASFTAGPNSGCIPFDPFTTDSASNAAAIDWIWIPTTNSTENEQFVIQGFVTAQSSPWFELPGGPAQIVLGGEYRSEESNFRFDELSGSPRVVAQINGQDLSGDFNVTEVFTEVSLPVLGDVGPMLQGVTVDGAVRYSDYSTIGSTLTWKAGAIVESGGGFTLRGTYSSAVRAPNVGELFEIRRNTSTSLGQFDPCAAANLDLGTEFRRANCATELSALGVDPNTFDPLLGTFFPAIEGGNPNLNEETAKTKTIGILWRPEFLSGFTLSADYFDIKIEDAVLRPDSQAIFDACYDSATLDNVFCPLIGRNATTGEANFVERVAVNVAELRTSGIEFASIYKFPELGFGDFTASLNGTWLQRLDIQRTPLPVLTDEKGLFTTFLSSDSVRGGSSPEWVVNFDLTWSYGKWDANYGLNYNSKTLRPPLINAQRDNAAEVLNDPYVDPFFNHDIQIGYRLRESARIYAGVTNLGDSEPDAVRGSLNGASGRQGFAGRTFYIGANLSFPELF